jgi:hypothetical protein
MSLEPELNGKCHGRTDGRMEEINSIPLYTPAIFKAGHKKGKGGRGKNKTFTPFLPETHAIFSAPLGSRF